MVKQAARRVPVLIGTGAEWTDELVRTSREAESTGADGVMIIPPFYSVPTDDFMRTTKRCRTRSASRS